MAGYLFTLDSLESLTLCVTQGLYATIVEPKRYRDGRGFYWGSPQEGTFADYCTMKPEDNVYFFIQRKIYGIGELVAINNLDCKFLNYPNSSNPSLPSYEEIRTNLLLDNGSNNSIHLRWVCVFKPSPYFFQNGIDMDELLSSNPSEFKMVRALWRLSFIKFTDRENAAFKDAMLKYNEEALIGTPLPALVFENSVEASHARLSHAVTNDYLFKVIPILDSCSDGETVGHEMALEAGLLFQLSREDEETIGVFGKWDYLSHQVIASPFKAIDYMDKMDVFGYRYVQGYRPIVSKYLVCELKKDEIQTDDVDQVMKYVDWIKQEYGKGDYSMIEAFLVGCSIPDHVQAYGREYGKRQFTRGSRPAKNETWNDLRFVEYRYDRNTEKVSFRRVDI